ncbi:MAG: hypothetical protein WDW38_004106 [Sanguina aurantia]
MPEIPLSLLKMQSTADKFRRKAFVVRSLEETSDRSASGFDMHRVLGAFDLLLLGTGCIIGAGVVVLTGVAARTYAGPAVVLSYALSGAVALLASLCYAEYAADMPVAGGAYNFISMTFGEYAAWVAACDLILEYTLSAAAVAKGFTAYFAALFAIPIHRLRFQAGIFTLDPIALTAVVVLSLLLARGTRESKSFNNCVVAMHMALIVFVIAVGFPYAKSENYVPFAPFGVRGVFTGASVVFFSFIGFDTVACASEEVKNPKRDLPIGIVGSLSFCTVIYILMCLVITGMQKYTEIDLSAPFAVAFDSVGLHWATRIVAAGALTGICTSLMGSLMGQSRIYVTLGRHNLLPVWLARVNPATGTPINAQLVTCVTAGFLALFLDLELLAELVSIGTLVVFAMVCSGVLFRRYTLRGQPEALTPVLLRILAIIMSAVGFSLSFTEEAPIAVPIVFAVLWLLITSSFLLLPVKYLPQNFRVPLSPFLPALGVFSTLHLIGSLGWPAYVRWIVWFALGTCVYICYGLHRSQGEGTGDGGSPRPSISSGGNGNGNGVNGGSSNGGGRLQMLATASASSSDTHRRKESTEMTSLLSGKVHKSDSTGFHMGG